MVYFRIDRRRKIQVTSLLRALGLTTNEIISTFYDTVTMSKGKRGWSVPFDAKKLRNVFLRFDLVNAANGKIIVEADKKVTAKMSRDLDKENIKETLLSAEELETKYVGEDIVDKESGEVVITAGSILTVEHIEKLDELKAKEIKLVDFDGTSGPYIMQSLEADKNLTREDAMIDIYKVMRPGEPPTVEAAEVIFSNLFFDADRYDLSDVGRMKMNTRVGLDVDGNIWTLTKEDILAIIKTLIDIKDGKGVVDDIDHLGNRRVRSVGELIENQLRIGLLRMDRAITDRMSAVEADTIMPYDLINAKPLAAVIKEFFGSSQLSQFMDQTNPLAEVTHKRRLSALGPGGLTRERAGFEVRDVHTTHYGRICPIETPEGPNIGLINSLATYARINKYGFIESPYRKVKDGKITDEVVYLSAIEEGKYTIAQADAILDKKGKFTDDIISCRKNNDFVMAKPEEIEFADVSPKQIVSVAASLIPFLENDDANRALMGSNMMRQAVPLVRLQAPIVGTGMESIVAKDSGSVIIANNDGVVDQVDATRIVVKATGKKCQKVIWR